MGDDFRNVSVMPAKAGIQALPHVRALDSRFRGNDTTLRALILNDASE